jgi:sugar phosphate isomerase/epimerase
LLARFCCALDDLGYTGPLSVEWEDSRIDREHGAKEACSIVRYIEQLPPSAISLP